MPDTKKTGAELIAAERQRQISQEGWTPEHDDKHDCNQMARAAEAYVYHYRSLGWMHEPALGKESEYLAQSPPEMWPWDEKWWKPKDPLSDLVKAGALIAAEIDRLQRLQPEE